MADINAGTTTNPNPEVRRERYIKGVCTRCGEREHQAGSPLCETCLKLYRRHTP